jgi:S-DNA-T family DNA segregation ATPase FtsK/SpoIIIE
VVDGVGPLRSALREARWPASEALLDRVLREGAPVGVTAVLADHGAAGASATWPVAERWLYHVDDPALGTSLGVRIPAVPGDVPGRLRVLSSGLEAQVALGADGLAALPARSRGTGPPSVDVLPPAVAAARITGAVERAPAGVTRLPIGLGAEDLRPVCLDVPDGEHVVVVGAAGTGVTTALDRVAAAWAERHGPGSVLRWRPGADEAPDAGGGRRLVVVDDAHRVEDPVLAALAAGRVVGSTLAVGARADAVRAAYGHWTRDATRSRCGIVMCSPGGADGELLGATLATRTLVAPRPGLGWVVDGRGARLAQIAGGPAP